MDDEPLSVELMEGILSKDYEIIKASSGIGALIEIEKILPDLILLDIMMPNMNGYAVCKELKSSNKTMKIPILMITALKEDMHKTKSIEAGVDDFISKPVDVHELSEKIKSWIRIKDEYSYNLPISSNTHNYKVF